MICFSRTILRDAELSYTMAHSIRELDQINAIIDPIAEIIYFYKEDWIGDLGQVSFLP